MKYVLVLFALIFGACAHAQSPVLPGPGLPVAGGGSTVAITYQATTFGSTSGGAVNITIPSSSIGTASATRRVVYMITNFGHVPGETYTGTITPNVGSPVSIDSGSVIGCECSGAGYGVFYASAVVPTGTTAVLTLSFSGGAGFPDSPRASVYTLDNSVLSSPTTPNTGGGSSTGALSSISASANASAGAGVIGSSYNGAAAGALSSSPAGISNLDGSFGTSNWGHADNVAASTPYTVTISYGSANEGAIGILVYR